MSTVKKERQAAIVLEFGGNAIMGPNGSGKSTLSKVIAGHPSFKISEGSISYKINAKEKNLLELEADERAKNGIFLGFQYPVEITSYFADEIGNCHEDQ